MRTSANKLKRCGVGLLAGGLLFGGPCGVTTLQFQDFTTSTLIRVGVQTVASLYEAAVLAQAGGATDGANEP